MSNWTGTFEFIHRHRWFQAKICCCFFFKIIRINANHTIELHIDYQKSESPMHSTKTCTRRWFVTLKHTSCRDYIIPSIANSSWIWNFNIFSVQFWNVYVWRYFHFSQFGIEHFVCMLQYFIGNRFYLVCMCVCACAMYLCFVCSDQDKSTLAVQRINALDYRTECSEDVLNKKKPNQTPYQWKRPNV